MKKTNHLKLLLLLPVILIMVLIFIFSSENSEDSSKTSGVITDFIISIINKDYDNMEENEKLEYRDKVSFVVRKLAHFSIFASLSFFMLLALINLMPSYSYLRLSLMSFSISSLYAMNDEIHQLFSSGRACEIRDLLIDMAGVVFGILVLLLIVSIINSIKKKRNKKEV